MLEVRKKWKGIQNGLIVQELLENNVREKRAKMLKYIRKKEGLQPNYTERRNGICNL